MGDAKGAPTSGVKRRIDWASLVEELKLTPGEERLVGDDFPGATRTYLKRKYGLGARMEGQDPATFRGKLYVWWPA